MKSIVTGKRLFGKTAEGTDSLGNKRFTVRARKGFITGGRYDILVEYHKRQPFKESGNFISVLDSLKASGNPEGVELLREVAESISDPGRRLTTFFTENQLACMAVLTPGAESLGRIAEKGGISELDAAMALANLRKSNLVYRSEPEEGSPRFYGLKHTGKRMVHLLSEEKKFQDILDKANENAAWGIG
ncbi:hypothetical protein GF318_05020 [Candidatus Micrarchaeota archaeon]|nr:hypothetical protein [Candidatus Micrarchaeota archaeon]